MNNLNLDFTGPVSCYNGAFDSASSDVFKERERIMEKIRTIEPGAHVTWHHSPVDRAVVHVWGREISSYCPTIGQAIACAYSRLFPLHSKDND